MLYLNVTKVLIDLLRQISATTTTLKSLMSLVSSHVVYVAIFLSKCSSALRARELTTNDVVCIIIK